VLLGVPVGLALGTAALPWIADRRIDLLALLALPAAGLFIAVAWRRFAAGDWTGTAAAAALLAAPLYAATLWATLPRLDAPWVSVRLAAELRRTAPSLAPEGFASVGHHEPSLLFATSGATRLLPDGPAGAAFLAEQPGRIVAVEARQQAAFLAEAARLGVTPRTRGRVEGFNYTRGRRVTITLYGSS
jgi:hypothetical protein